MVKVEKERLQTKKLRIVNLISQTGSTSLEVIRAQKPGGVLDGLVETVAVVTSNGKIGGLERAVEEGFPKNCTHEVSKKSATFDQDLINFLRIYNPDYVFQLGWLPYTPENVHNAFQFLNMHIGPGGQFMFGERRIYAHMRFCELIGESRPIPLFCHRVTSGYDKGKTIYAQWEEIYPWETAKEVAKRLYLIEHKVQIHALYLLATGQVKESNAVSIPTSYYEEELLKQAIEDSLEKLA